MHNKMEGGGTMKKQPRVHAIDGMRGFSLFGILLANLLIFQYGLFGKDYIELFGMSSFDQSVYTFIKVAIEDSFMPIFTFLFGYSLMMMRGSLANKQLRIKWHLFRRSILLLVFGILHATYLWEGDILFVYGLMGICLLVFVNRQAKTILIWACLLFTFFVVVSLPFLEEGDLFDSHTVHTYVDKTTSIYGQGTYSEIKDHRNNAEDPLSDMMEDSMVGIAALFMMPVMIAPMFLLGMYAGAKEWLLRPKDAERGCKIGAFLCLPLGFGLKTYAYYAGVEGLFSLGGTVLALGYMCSIGLLYAKLKKNLLLQLFEKAGKLSLTNYIMQTIICTTIFYGYGIGLFGKLGMAGAFVLGVFIFGLQMIASSFYLRHFRYGPLEKILRMGTYLSFSSKAKTKKHHTENTKAV